MYHFFIFILAFLHLNKNSNTKITEGFSTNVNSLGLFLKIIVKGSPLLYLPTSPFSISISLFHYSKIVYHGDKTYILLYIHLV